MSKKITLTIDVEKLRMSDGKKKLVNLRVDEDLYRSFKQVCEAKFGQGMSDILRKIMRELCDQKF